MIRIIYKTRRIVIIVVITEYVDLRATRRNPLLAPEALTQQPLPNLEGLVQVLGFLRVRGALEFRA